MRIEVLRKSGNWTEAKLVDVLPRGQNADAQLVYKYYGLAAPISAFAAHRMARLVFRYNDDAYYIVPDNLMGKRFWRFTNETQTN